MSASVSVIIPCYCCADTISRAVDSVLTQTLRPKEVFLIDDCSNDGGKTLKVINKIQSENIKIKVIQLDKNSGPGSARNAGWEGATQPYIAFLDADDSWHPKKLEVQYQWMCDHPDVVLTGHPSPKISSCLELPRLPLQISSRRVNKYSLLLTNYFPTRSVMLKKDISFRFFPEKRYAEDYWLWLSIVFSGRKSYLLNMPMAYTYKEEFGDGGLAGNLWKTQKGVIDTYQKLYHSKSISRYVLFIVSSFSWLKYFRRWLITWHRIH
ncbi:MAG: glycosyltransferase family 2 protein [Methylococcales bacterium]